MKLNMKDVIETPGGILVEAPKKLAEELKRKGFVQYCDYDWNPISKEEWLKLRSKYATTDN